MLSDLNTLVTLIKSIAIVFIVLVAILYLQNIVYRKRKEAKLDYTTKLNQQVKAGVSVKKLPAPKSNLDREVYGEFLMELVSQVNDEVILDLVKILAQTHLSLYYRKSLKSLSQEKRLSTLRKIYRLDMPGYKKSSLKKLESNLARDEKILLILVAFAGDTKALVEYLNKQSDLNFDEYCRLFKNMKESDLNSLSYYYQSLPEQAQRAFDDYYQMGLVKTA